MGFTLTQNWGEDVLSVPVNMSDRANIHCPLSRAINIEDDFQLSKDSLLTKLSLYVYNNNCDYKAFIISLNDRKVIYLSDVIEDKTETEQGVYLNVYPNITLGPEIGPFAVGYILNTDSSKVFSQNSTQDSQKIGACNVSFSNSNAWTSISVGSNLASYNPSLGYYIGVKLEFDEEVSIPDPSPTDMKLHILLKKDQTVNLTGYMWPVGDNPPNLIWSSEDNSIASVGQNGTVTANAVGKTKIYVQNEDGSFKAFARIKVVEEGEDELLLSILLEIGESCILVPEFDPQEAETAVLWTSSDSSIATVNAVGKVTGLAEGLAIITAQTADGKLTDSIYVTVKPQD